MLKNKNMLDMLNITLKRISQCKFYIHLPRAKNKWHGKNT